MHIHCGIFVWVYRNSTVFRWWIKAVQSRVFDIFIIESRTI